MRIVDRKKDYYDCIQRLGQDQTCVYVRKRQEIQLEKYAAFPSNYFFKTVLIGFCGEVYIGVCVPPADDFGWRGTPEPEYYCFSLEKALANFDQYSPKYKAYGKQRVSNARAELQQVFNGPRHDLLHRNQSNQEKYYKACYGKIFREHRVPVFVVHQVGNVYIELNALLNEFGFQQVMDPYTAFQKIHMFMSGVLGPEPKIIPDIDDQTRAALHGYDKHSFRADSGVKPNRKSRKKARKKAT